MNHAWTRYLPTFVREKLDGRPELQQVISSTAWLVADNIFRMGVGLLVGIWVTRYLGPDRYGRLSYAIAFVTLFSSVAMLGLDGIVIRNLIRDPARRNETLGSAFALKLLGGAVASGVTLAAIFMLRASDHETLMLVGITCIGQIFQAFGTIDFWFQSQVQSKYPAIARSAVLPICSLGKIALILCHAPLTAFAWVGAAEMVLGSLGLVVAYRMCGHRLRQWRASVPLAKVLLRDSWPLILTDVVTTTYMRLDKIMIGELAGNHELGIYTVAALLADAMCLLPRAISTSMFPGIVAARGESEEVFQAKLQQFFNLMAFLAYTVAIPVTLAASWAIPLMFGPAYAKAAPMLIGLAWTGMFINFWIALSYYLTTMNWNRLQFVTESMGCLANVGVNFLLIPRFGGMGAVAASCAAYWFATQGACFLFKPLRKTGFMLTKAMFYPKIW